MTCSVTVTTVPPATALDNLYNEDVLSTKCTTVLSNHKGGCLTRHDTMTSGEINYS